jgi:flavin-dependent dehydrogenase
MGGNFDVVIVGARCAGAPLATLLARSGLEVAVVEQAISPGKTLSSHVFEADALAFLDRLGLSEQIRATGAPLVKRAELRMEDFSVTTELPRRTGDIGGAASIRRELLDPILVGAAEEAGASVQMATKAVGLLSEAGRVTGISVKTGGKRSELHAPLVVGADGRNSSVAKFCGARRYNVSSNERIVYWGYFEGAAPEPEPTFRFHRWSDRFVIGMPADSGLYQAGVWPEASELEQFGGDHEALFEDYLERCEPIAAMVSGARRVGKLQGAVKWEGYFREASGPGWVLAGDAGHFKDPAPGRGIGDALLQADTLAPAIVRGLDGSGDGMDQAMSDWARWRDEEFAEHYWLANDLGKAGPVPPVLVEIVRRLDKAGKIDDFLNVLNHRAKPSQVVTPPVLLGAVGRMVARGDGGGRKALLGEAAALGIVEARRRWLNRFPTYEAA